MERKKVAVFFGGKSFEHDVSILTGLQSIQAMDIMKYEAIPVYVDKDGNWWTGKELLNINNYPLKKEIKNKLKKVYIEAGVKKTKPQIKLKKGILRKDIEFDIALLSFHGGEGENGGIQGLFEVLSIPYTGCDVLSSSIYMSKLMTKMICRELGIKVLKEIVLKKPQAENFIDIKEITKDMNISYPICVKAGNLGSSIGVYKAKNEEELNTYLLEIFKMDDEALIEPFVENLIEYNIAVMKDKDGNTITSAIESPNNNNDYLSFKDKYLSGDESKKKNMNISAMPSDELIKSRRIFAPKLTKEQEDFIRNSAKILYEELGGKGSPRIDFLSDEKSGEIWLNEVNPIPGANAFYLWQNSEYKMNYTELLDTMIENGMKNYKEKEKQIDLKIASSIIFK